MQDTTPPRIVLKNTASGLWLDARQHRFAFFCAKQASGLSIIHRSCHAKPQSSLSQLVVRCTPVAGEGPPGD